MSEIPRTTFWNLLSGGTGEDPFRIIIPRIQRDYAHGRTGKAETEVREALLRDLIGSLGEGTSSVDLGLIFGAEKGGAVILYDGQQRFTTLFLLHWYLAWQAGKLEDARNALLGFSYDSRLHSRDFCRMLCKWPSAAPGEELKPSEIFDDSTRFCLEWRRDPTVAGMLVVLDALHGLLRGEDVSGKWEALVSDRAPTFRWLRLDGQSAGGDFYIRLNSRGRPLTDFEKLKAWLEGEAKDWDLPEGWQHDLDNKWLDLFWKQSKNDPGAMDSSMLAFFTGTALGLALSQEEKKEEGQTLTRSVHEGAFLTKAEWSRLFTEKTVSNLLKILEFLARQDVIEEIKKWGGQGKILIFAGKADHDLVNHWISRMGAKGDISYAHRLLFHGLAHFMIAYPPESAGWNEKAFTGWMRFVRNLAWNAGLDHSTFPNAIRVISGLQPDPAAGYPAMLRDEPKPPTGLSGDQWEDEIRKAKFRQRQDQAALDLLAKAEDQPFLRGEIGFLIDLSTERGSFDPGRFASYVDTMARLFPTDKGPDNRVLVQRALLSAGDFVAEHSNRKWTLGGNRKEWRWIFRDQADRHRNGKGDDRPLGILLDAGPSVDLGEFVNWHEKNLGWGNWRKWMVQTPAPIGFCGGSLFGWKEEGHTVILVPNVNFSSTAELRTYVLFKSHFEGEGSGYHYAYGRNERSHLYWQNHSHRLEIRYIGYLDAAEPFAFRLLGRRDDEVRLDGFGEDERPLLPLDEYERKSKWASYGIRRTSVVDPSLLAEEIRKIVGVLSRMEDVG